MPTRSKTLTKRRRKVLTKTRPRVFSLTNPPAAPRKPRQSFPREKLFHLPTKFREMQWRLLRSYVDDEEPMTEPDDWLTFINGCDVRCPFMDVQLQHVYAEEDPEVVREWQERYSPASQPHTLSEHAYCLLIQQACERQLDKLNTINPSSPVLRPSTPPSPVLLPPSPHSLELVNSFLF